MYSQSLCMHRTFPNPIALSESFEQYLAEHTHLLQISGPVIAGGAYSISGKITCHPNQTLTAQLVHSFQRKYRGWCVCVCVCVCVSRKDLPNLNRTAHTRSSSFWMVAEWPCHSLACTTTRLLDPAGIPCNSRLPFTGQSCTICVPSRALNTLYPLVSSLTSRRP